MSDKVIQIKDGEDNALPISNQYFIVESKTFGPFTLEAGAAKTLSGSIAKTGYQPFGIIGYNINGTNVHLLMNSQLTIAGNNASFRFNNIHSAVAISNFYVIVNVLYLKSIS